MAKPKLILYLDIVSPFAYLAFHVVRTSPVFKACDVTYVPVLLGGIMQATGNRPPVAVKNKAKWIAKDRVRWAEAFKVPMAKTVPPGFPQITIEVERALTAVAEFHPDRLEEAYTKIYHKSFVDLQEVHKFEHIRPVLAEMFGEAVADELISQATGDQIKAKLKENTDHALESGSFGLPWYEATNGKGDTEFNWGFDHIGQVADHLGLERLKPDISSEGGWKTML